MTRADFARILAHSPRGTRIVYHTGFLARDRIWSVITNNLAEAVWQAAGMFFYPLAPKEGQWLVNKDDARCVLVQRRIKKNTYEYIAVRL